jgi:HK97 family phage portal protein
MSILRRIIGEGETRALNRIGGFLPFDRVPATSSDTDVNAALNLTAYNAGIRLLADTVSTLPIDSYIRRDGVRYPFRPKPIWLTEPDPRNQTQTIQSLLSQMIVSLYTNGNVFVATLRDTSGEVQELRVLNPERVHVQRDADGSPIYTVTNGKDTVVAGADEIKHIPLLRLPGEERGIDLLRANAQAIRTGLAIEDYANAYFVNGANPSGVVKIPAEQKREVTEALKDQLRHAQTGSKRWSMLLLTGGADFQEFRGVDPEQTQLLASRTFTVLQICRLLRIPPSMLSVTDPGAMSYASVEQQTLAFVRDTVRPLASLLESALGTLITNPDAFVRFGLEGLLRGASADRASFYTQLLQQGIISTNEARALEDLRPIDGGDNYRMPLNEAPSMAVADSRARAEVLDKLVGSGVPLDQARKIAGI